GLSHRGDELRSRRHAVLDAHVGQEKSETERSDAGRGNRLRHPPAHGERDEQHCAHAQRKTLDADLSHEIADGDVRNSVTIGCWSSSVRMNSISQSLLCWRSPI